MIFIHRLYKCLCEKCQSTQKTLLGMTFQHSNVALQKVNMQRAMVLLYNRNEKLETENVKNLKIYGKTKQILKSLGIDLLKICLKLYNKNYKLGRKKSKRDLKKKDSLYKLKVLIHLLLMDLQIQSNPTPHLCR